MVSGIQHCRIWFQNAEQKTGSAQKLFFVLETLCSVENLIVSGSSGDSSLRPVLSLRARTGSRAQRRNDMGVFPDAN